MVSAVTLPEVLTKSHTRPASSLETIVRSKKHTSKRKHKLVVRPNAKSFLERWRSKDRMVREDAINDTSLDLSLKQQLISHSTSFLASAIVFGISAYPAESQAALMPATQMAFLGRIETPAKKADPVPSLEEITDECLYDPQTQDNGCDEPKSGEGKTANGAQELVSQVQAKTQEWGPGKTAAAVVVGGVGLVALAAFLGVDVAVALLASPGLVAMEATDLGVSAGIAGLATGAAEVAPLVEGASGVASVASSASLSAPAVVGAVAAEVAVDAATGAAGVTVATSGVEIAGNVAAAATAEAAGNVAASSIAAGSSTATTVAAAGTVVGAAEVASNVAGGASTVAGVSGASTSTLAAGAAGTAAVAEVATNVSAAGSGAGAVMGGAGSVASGTATQGIVSSATAAATTLGSKGAGVASGSSSVVQRAAQRAPLPGAAVGAAAVGVEMAEVATVLGSAVELEVGAAADLLATEAVTAEAAGVGRMLTCSHRNRHPTSCNSLLGLNHMSQLSF